VTPEKIQSTVYIHAPAGLVWKFLTDPRLMKSWMADEDSSLEIVSANSPGGELVIRGILSGKRFENKGTITRFKPEVAFGYTHLSSLSSLPDDTENFCRIEFELSPESDGTRLDLCITNFPTPGIYKHMELYWKATLLVLRTVTERDSN
jgi:uncharacterized protein YndB with AHSA1/START domain